MKRGTYTNSCDLLSFYYLCRTGNNGYSGCYAPSLVVICFHFTIFVVLETTGDYPMRHWFTLWFAFILLSLSYWKQHLALMKLSAWRCDLLSFYYLCRTGNNYNDLRLNRIDVVICFHFTIFVVLETTTDCQTLCRTGCDLLSFYYLCRTGNNLVLKTLRNWIVVICFHFTIFVVLETTNAFAVVAGSMLWFAFILLSLSYWKQPVLALPIFLCSCDLLSFYYLCRTGNNAENENEITI